MKKLVLLPLLSLFCASAIAQSSFQKAIDLPFSNNTAPKRIIQCSDNGYLIGLSGYYGGVNIIKTDAAGAIQWAKNSATNATYATLADFGESSSGGYFFLTEGYDSAYSILSFFLTMTDANGNYLWSRTYATGSFSYGSSKVKQMADGGFMISESLYSKMGMLRTDATGNVIWHHSFTADTSSSGKNPSFDCCINSDGSTITTGKRENDICIVKADGSGNPIWIKTMSNGFGYYHANSIAPTPDGGYVIGGYEDYYAFAMKIDASGNPMWYKIYNDASGSIGSIEQVRVDGNGNIVMNAGGSFIGGSSVIICDPMGNVMNAFTYGDGINSTMSDLSLCLTNDWGMVINGWYSNTSTSQNAIVLMKLDASMQPGCEARPLTVTTSSSPNGAPAQISVQFFTINESLASSSTSNTLNSSMSYETDFCLLFDVNEHADMTSIKAYPNPASASDALHMNIVGVNGETIISIFDASGKMVRSMNETLTNNNNIDIALDGMNAGIYIARITDRNGNLVGITRFIIE